jgi:ribonuclease E
MGERAPIPSAAAITRAETLTREPFLHAGEVKAEALAVGTPRRRALDMALAEAKAGLTIPSLQWRHEFSLLLGLERVLTEDEPKLADGTTTLSPHQVDALSGTLTALLTLTAGGAAEAAALGTPPPSSGSGDDAGGANEPAADGSPAGTANRSAAHTANGSPSSANGSGTAAAPAARPAASSRRAKPALDIDDLDDLDELDDDDEVDDEELDDEVEVDPEDAADADALDEPEHEDEEPQDFADDNDLDQDAVVDADDPGADRRFWFEHATGAGKTVAAMGFVEACRTGGVLILTHRRNLVDQFIDEIKTRGYKDRLCPPLLIGEDAANGPVTVETYQWFVRNAGKISDAYAVVICDEAHTALGEKTSAQIRSWDKPIWIGMTATGALIARHVTDLFPTQTSRFDLAQAARRGVISPLRCIRIPPGPGVRTIAKVPLRRGEVDTEFDQEMLAELLDQTPFNLAIADLYKTRFNGLPGVVYAAGVKHAYNVAESFRALDMKAMAVSGETPKRELAKILADYEAGKVDVLVNAQLLAEGWNSPRATICMHLAPTASKRIYQQRVGRVTRRHPGKEAGIVIDFVHPATKHDDPVVTLHSLLDRDVYRGGAIVIGPVRRGRGRRIRVERRVLPVTPDPDRRAEVFERELWRIAVEHLDYGEQHVWAALAGARVQANGWRRAKAMLHFDRQGELRRRFLLTALERNKSAQLRQRALQEIAASRDAEAFDTAIDMMANWPRDERREGVKVMLLALAERRIGRRDQANAWIWRMAEYTRDVHEEYAAQRWPETKRLLGLLVNSSGSAHARNARRLVHATRTQDRRLSAALLAAALAHTPEAEEALRGARTRMARKPAALARELLRNFPKGKKSSKRRRKGKSGSGEGVAVTPVAAARTDTVAVDGGETTQPTKVTPRRRTRRRRGGSGGSAIANAAAKVEAAVDAEARAGSAEAGGSQPKAGGGSPPEVSHPRPESPGSQPEAAAAKPKAAPRRRVSAAQPEAAAAQPEAAATRPKAAPRRRVSAAQPEAAAAKPKAATRRRVSAAEPKADAAEPKAAPKPRAAAKPKAATAKPKAAARPKAATAKPKAAAAKPDADGTAAKPKAEAGRPKVAAARRKVTSAQAEPAENDRRLDSIGDSVADADLDRDAA